MGPQLVDIHYQGALDIISIPSDIYVPGPLGRSMRLIDLLGPGVMGRDGKLVYKGFRDKFGNPSANSQLYNILRQMRRGEAFAQYNSGLFANFEQQIAKISATASEELARISPGRIIEQFAKTLPTTISKEAPTVSWGAGKSLIHPLLGISTTEGVHGEINAEAVDRFRNTFRNFFSPTQNKALQNLRDIKGEPNMPAARLGDLRNIHEVAASFKEEYTIGRTKSATTRIIGNTVTSYMRNTDADGDLIMYGIIRTITPSGKSKEILIHEKFPLNTASAGQELIQFDPFSALINHMHSGKRAGDLLEDRVNSKYIFGGSKDALLDMGAALTLQHQIGTGNRQYSQYATRAKDYILKDIQKQIADRDKQRLVGLTVARQDRITLDKLLLERDKFFAKHGREPNVGELSAMYFSETGNSLLTSGEQKSLRESILKTSKNTTPEQGIEDVARSVINFDDRTVATSTGYKKRGSLDITQRYLMGLSISGVLDMMHAATSDDAIDNRLWGQVNLNNSGEVKLHPDRRRIDFYKKDMVHGRFKNKLDFAALEDIADPKNSENSLIHNLLEPISYQRGEALSALQIQDIVLPGDTAKAAAVRLTNPGGHKYGTVLDAYGQEHLVPVSAGIGGRANVNTGLAEIELVSAGQIVVEHNGKMKVTGDQSGRTVFLTQLRRNLIEAKVDARVDQGSRMFGGLTQQFDPYRITPGIELKLREVINTERRRNGAVARQITDAEVSAAVGAARRGDLGTLRGMVMEYDQAMHPEIWGAIRKATDATLGSLSEQSLFKAVGTELRHIDHSDLRSGERNLLLSAENVEANEVMQLLEQAGLNPNIKFDKTGRIIRASRVDAISSIKLSRGTKARHQAKTNATRIRTNIAIFDFDEGTDSLVTNVLNPGNTDFYGHELAESFQAKGPTENIAYRTTAGRDLAIDALFDQSLRIHEYKREGKYFVSPKGERKTLAQWAKAGVHLDNHKGRYYPVNLIDLNPKMVTADGLLKIEQFSSNNLAGIKATTKTGKDIHALVGKHEIFDAKGGGIEAIQNALNALQSTNPAEKEKFQREFDIIKKALQEQASSSQPQIDSVMAECDRFLRDLTKLIGQETEIETYNRETRTIEKRTAKLLLLENIDTFLVGSAAETKAWNPANDFDSIADLENYQKFGGMFTNLHIAAQLREAGYRHLGLQEKESENAVALGFLNLDRLLKTETETGESSVDIRKAADHIILQRLSQFTSSKTHLAQNIASSFLTENQARIAKINAYKIGQGLAVDAHIYGRNSANVASQLIHGIENTVLKHI